MATDKIQPKKMNRKSAAVALNGNGWKKRQIETLTCPSGQSVQVRRPGPEFVLRAGKVARTFSAIKPKEGADPAEFIEHLSEEEQAAVVLFARELVCAMVVSPPLVRNPTADEVGPEDIGDDFWFLFNYAMTGYYGLFVPAGNGEVQVSDLGTFREERGVQGTGDHGEAVQPADQQAA